MVIVAVGANLPQASGATAFQTCQWAIERLAALPRMRVATVSRWYRSVPVPVSDQPDYCNGAVLLEGALGPEELLAALHAIEAAAGRARSAVNAARTLDLDLIDHDGACRADTPPMLPHPRAHLRRFVLLPLRDVAPGWVHPRLGVGVDSLIAGLPEEGISLWEG